VENEMVPKRVILKRKTVDGRYIDDEMGRMMDGQMSRQVSEGRRKEGGGELESGR
jgi:hypothetical protein